MSQEREQPIKSFAELGAAFGLKPDQAGVQEKDFDGLSPMKKLRACISVSEKRKPLQERREKKTNAIASALRLHRNARSSERIQIITIGDLDDKFNIIPQDFGSHGAKTYVLFPEKGKTQLLSVIDSLLVEREDLSREMICKGSDQVRAEAPIDRHIRLNLNVKHLDTKIAEQKQYVYGTNLLKGGGSILHNISKRAATLEMDKLNQRKSIVINDIFKTTQIITDEFPQLLSLFTSTIAPNGLHVNLEIRSLEDLAIKERLLNPEVPPQIAEARSVVTTNLSMVTLQRAYKAYQLEPQNVPNYVKSNAEIYEYLQYLGQFNKDKG